MEGLRYIFTTLLFITLFTSPILAQSETECPLLDCETKCEFGNVLDSNNCPTCACNESPQIMAIAVPVLGVSQIGKKCPPVCDMICEFGNVVDKNGCPICQCREGGALESESTVTGVSATPKCLGVKCALFCEFGYVLGADGCALCKCKNKPGPIICDDVCAIFCPFGNETDENGCPICSCKNDPKLGEEESDDQSSSDPCAGKTCPAGEVCKQIRSSCKKGKKCPEKYYAVCEKKPFRCPPVCAIFCGYGNVRDVNGCKTCNCLGDPSLKPDGKKIVKNPLPSNPCGGKVCPKGKVCKNIRCKCERGKKCPEKYYASCEPAPKTPTPPKCPKIVSTKHCKYGPILDKNGCPTARCYDPCNNVKCPYGQVCEPEEVLCIRQPCPVLTKCVSVDMEDD